MNKTMLFRALFAPLLLWCLLCYRTSAAATAPPAENYLQVEAQQGDGIYALLRRYQLDAHTCNFSRFYELNELQKNAPLYSGKSYYLPVLLVNFNGRTIRSSVGIDDWSLAVRIQEYNEVMYEAGLRATSFRDDKVLWVPYHYLNCPEEVLPVADKQEPEEADDPVVLKTDPEYAEKVSLGNRTFPIFGPDYQKTPLRSNALAGQVYYIVSGHGGPDPGAIGREGSHQLCEDEYAYDVCLRLCRKLIEHGASAYMVTRDENDGIRSDRHLGCDTDEVLWGGIEMFTGHRGRLYQRSGVINNLYQENKEKGVTVQRMIIIHVDSRSKGEQIDLFFYHRQGDPDSKKLAKRMYQTMAAKYKKYRRSGQYHGTVESRDLHMLRETLVPEAVYIELGNIRNSWDQQRILLESNREALARWMFEGLSRK